MRHRTLSAVIGATPRVLGAIGFAGVAASAQ